MTPTAKKIDEAAKHCHATRKCEGCPFYGPIELEGSCPEHFAKAYLSSRAEVEALRKALIDITPDGDLGYGISAFYIHADTIKRARKALEGKE